MRHTERKQRCQDLTELLDRIDRRGYRSVTAADVKNLCRLYRQVTIDLSRARSDGEDPEFVRYLNYLAARAHGRVYATRRIEVRKFFDFIARGFPRAVRRRAKPLLTAGAVFVLAAILSCFAVLRDPQVAYSLFDENLVEFENVRLERHGDGEYRGNFTFDLSDSPWAAVAIITNNIRVAIMAFALGAVACLPGLVLLIYNGRMFGTLTGITALHGVALDFYALVMTHGVLELTAICIAAGAGFTLGWALIAPGSVTRKDALRQAAPDAFTLFGGVAVMLVIAGVIEAFVTPHFSQPVRWATAIGSGLLFVMYLAWGMRTPSKPIVSQQAAMRDLQITVDDRRRDAVRLDVDDKRAHLANPL